MKLVVFLFILIPMQCLAWTKRGHEIVASTAARILEEKYNHPEFRAVEFDLGYYTNAPDILWRKDPAPISKLEPPLHYIDWTDDFKKVFGSPLNLPVEFKDFKEKLGAKFDVKKGLAPYRIHDIAKRCKDLKSSPGPLIVCLGLLSHYTGDLSMPLHTSENHDGQFTNQKGVHGFFESTLVDQLDPDIKVEVMEKALKTFESSKLKALDADQAVRWLIDDSFKKVDELLKIDKSLDRKDLKKSREKFHDMISQQLVAGAFLTAVVWADILKNVGELNFGDFSFFDAHPKYIFPEKN